MTTAEIRIVENNNILIWKELARTPPNYLSLSTELWFIPKSVNNQNITKS